MEFKVGFNTYMTVEEADQIVADEFDSSSEEFDIWTKSSEKDKERIILEGTRKTKTLVWRGIQYPGYQAMQWPRLIQYRYVECPYDVKVGILKQALRDKINNTKQETKLQELGVKSYSIKGASITFSAMNQSKLSNGVYDDIYKEYFEYWMA